MNVLVVENEKPAADKLCRLLRKIDNGIIIKDVTETIEDTITWLRENPAPDMILMDIQLDDGLCFEIFENVNVDVPVIFTTAFDEYTLRAFKVNSIDYLLKPVEEAALASALTKFKKIFPARILSRSEIGHLMKEVSGQYKSRFLIRTGMKYRSVPVSEISHFHIREKSVFLCDRNGKDHGVDYSLEQLQGLLDPDSFFRINRECIAGIDSINSISEYSSSRLQLTLGKSSDIFIVSRDKVTPFKRWIDR